MISYKNARADSRKKQWVSSWRIRGLEKADLEAVLAIERVSFPSPWSKAAFLQEIENPLSRCWVLESRDQFLPERVLGYLCVWVVLDEMHIMNLATHPYHRRGGIALKLLDHAFEKANEIGVDGIALEVRPSNVAARNLYRSLGFRAAGRRPGYYRDTGEDAIVMVKRM